MTNQLAGNFRRRPFKFPATGPTASVQQGRTTQEQAGQSARRSHSISLDHLLEWSTPDKYPARSDSSTGAIRRSMPWTALTARQIFDDNMPSWIPKRNVSFFRSRCRIPRCRNPLALDTPPHRGSRSSRPPMVRRKLWDTKLTTQLHVRREGRLALRHRAQQDTRTSATRIRPPSAQAVPLEKSQPGSGGALPKTISTALSHILLPPSTSVRLRLP